MKGDFYCEYEGENSLRPLESPEQEEHIVTKRGQETEWGSWQGVGKKAKRLKRAPGLNGRNEKLGEGRKPMS